MCSDFVIRVQDLSKCYHIYDKPQDRLKQSLWRGRKQFYSEFWALRDVSFEIKKGETVGIIGRNGSGKSTLLQMIAGTLTPTAGTVEVNGRVAALLELGSGFNPDFTGRENVYMNGAILGLSESEITARFDEIAAFADIGDFIEQPVKTYSSGMMLRLAFAVSVCVDPDILIVDEALSVGDEMFQRKCFARIQAIQERGASILFVSHSAQSVIELCRKAVLIDQGELLMDGTPKAVVAQYHRLIYATETKREILRAELRQNKHNFDMIADVELGKHEDKINSRPSAHYDPSLVPKSTVPYEMRGACIQSPQITLPDGTPVNLLVSGEEYLFSYAVKFSTDAYLVRFGVLIKTTSGFELGGTSSAPAGEGLPHVGTGSVVNASFRFRCRLLPGVYFFNAGCAGMLNGEEVFLHRLIDAAMFRVQPEEAQGRAGVVDFEIEPFVYTDSSHIGSESISQIRTSVKEQ